MKKRPITSILLSGAVAIAAILTLHPSFAQELKRSGKIEMKIDPGSPGFSMDQVEQNIRNSAKLMGLDAAQEKQLDEAIDQLRDNVKNLKNGGQFDWKWEFNGGTPPTKAKPKQAEQNAPRNLRNPRERAQQLDPAADPRDLFRKLFEQGGGGNGQGLDPQKLMDELLKQMGGAENGQQGPNGQRQFRFKLGPNGLEPEGGKGNEGGNNGGGGNPLEGLQKLFGQRDHMYDPDTAPRDSKYSRATLAEYRSCVKDARKSTVSVLKEGKQVSLGTVVSADGYVIAKASELGKGALECEFMNGDIQAAKLVSKLDAYDLALLKVEGGNFVPAKWNDADIPVGTMLAAAGIDEDPVSVGVLSVPSRNLDDSQKGFAGVGLDETADQKGVAVRSVVPDGPGAKAGLEVGDTILSIDGEKVNHPRELMKAIAAKGPGDVVKFSVKGSDGNEADATVTLSSREAFKGVLFQGVDPTARMGTDLSGRPSGFPNALQNDLGINANQCGGPVVDIDGNIVGLNIARSGRTSTLMLSSKLVKGMLSEVPSGKLSMVKDGATLDKELRRAEATLKAAQEALKAAQEAKEKAGQ